MKFEMGMRALSLLLVIALVGAIFVPAVSANDEPFNDAINASKGIKKILTPEELKNAPVHEPKVFDLQLLADAKTSPEFNDRQIEFIHAIFPEKNIIKTIDGESGGLISATIPESSARFVSQQPGVVALIPDIPLARSVQIEGPVFVLWAPKNMVEISDKGDSMTLIFPENLLMKYKDMNEAQKSIAASKEENLQINSDTIPSGESTLRSKAVTASDFQERSWYIDSNCADQINGVTGKIDPSGSYNYGESYFSYHEMEIYLSRPPYTTSPADTVEFISYHRTDNQKRAFVAVWDEGISQTVLDIDVTSVPSVEYYFYIENSAGWIYWMHFRNPTTGTWYTASWNDSDNPSCYVRDLRGSTELLSLQHVPPIYAFKTVTSPIRVDWTRTTSGWFTPSQTVSWNGYTPNEQYVNHLAFWNANGGIDTSHRSGSSVA